MTTRILLAAAFLFSITPRIALAHGEDKPGPHGGQIRMPGAFHTEVVVVSRAQIRVYLLDMQFSNPTTANSNVAISIDKSTAISCAAEGDYFTCPLPVDAAIDNAATLVVRAQRMGAPANPAVYELPLRESGK